ncbi:hypothetical protein Pfo_005297 [Paulownia fortunei]|nr:hypothetical protein Pfo_005297 [Paulownia fortunei]
MNLRQTKIRDLIKVYPSSTSIEGTLGTLGCMIYHLRLIIVGVGFVICGTKKRIPKIGLKMMTMKILNGWLFASFSFKIHPGEGTLGNFRMYDLSLGSDHRWDWLCDLSNQEVESLNQFTFNSYYNEDDDCVGFEWSAFAVCIVFLQDWSRRLCVISHLGLITVGVYFLICGTKKMNPNTALKTMTMKVLSGRLFTVRIVFLQDYIKSVEDDDYEGFQWSAFRCPHYFSFKISPRGSSKFNFCRGNFRKFQVVCDLSLGSDHYWDLLCDLRDQEVESLIKHLSNVHSVLTTLKMMIMNVLSGRLFAVRIIFLQDSSRRYFLDLLPSFVLVNQSDFMP